LCKTIWIHFSWQVDAGISLELFARSLHHPRNAMKIYRVMYILSKILSSMASYFVLYGQTCLLILCSLLIFFIFGYPTAGIMERLLASLGLVCFGTAGTYLVYEGGRVHTRTVELLSTWKFNYYLWRRRRQNINMEIDWKRLKSLQPFRIYAGNTYYLDARSVLVLWTAIIDKAILLFALHSSR